jgi:hypothetical protein
VAALPYLPRYGYHYSLEPSQDRLRGIGGFEATVRLTVYLDKAIGAANLCRQGR